MPTLTHPTTTPTPSVPLPLPRQRRVVRSLRTVTVAVVLAAGLVTVGSLIRSGPVVETTVASTAVDETEALRRLIALGYVPRAAFDAEAYATRQLTARRLIPSAPTARAGTVTDSTLTRSLVSRGLVPAETLVPTSERAVTASLVARGLVPSQTLR